MQGMSPLVIVTDQRLYTLAADLDKQATSSAESSLTDLSEAASMLTGYQAAFGSLHAQQQLAAASLQQQQVGRQTLLSDSAGGKAPWIQLFDSPSHVLPAPGQLLSSYLDLMLTGT